MHASQMKSAENFCQNLFQNRDNRSEIVRKWVGEWMWDRVCELQQMTEKAY